VVRVPLGRGPPARSNEVQDALRGPIADWLVVRIPRMAWASLAVLAGTFAGIGTVLLIRN